MGSWSASYVTGVPLMDTQHQELFKHMDDLVDKNKKNQIPEIIDYLGKYVDKHFREEQNLHASCNYPQREDHKKLHVDFVASYKKLKEDYKNSPGNATVMSLRISRTAVEWLKNHIFSADRTFARYYFSLPGHVKPKDANIGSEPASPKSDKPKLFTAGPATSFQGTAGVGADGVCNSDWEVLKRVPARALADELVRRSNASSAYAPSASSGKSIRAQ